MDYQEKIIEVIQKSLPAVVSIAASKNVELVEEDLMKMGMDPRTFEERLFGEADEKGNISVSGGSGFIVDQSGIILTNKHVIQDKAASYKAIIGQGKYDMEVIGQDPLSDIAILKIIRPPTNLSAIPLGFSKNVRLGTVVVAIGNALGEFQNTVSTGIVSGLSRFLSAITDTEGHQQRLRGLIQTDAAINPGNSGGPLINLSGEAIGINAAIVFGAQNIGFAIPIDRAKKDLEEIKKYGHVRSPFLGIRYVLLNKHIGRHFKIPVEHGALIVREGLPGAAASLPAVLPKSSAHEAGLAEHDIILAANDKDITEKETLEDILDSCSIGDSLKLKVLRKGKELNLKVKLEDRAKFS
ncbi:MAG: trypsin-like peptidase domain-containing protein [Candidatus Giovannonibacteria bacterium]|nr:MAG: trypsin-like peptidase domain-containing protein [Candidatus Giovannonibacteria bacterium]